MISKLIRPHFISLKPYSSARDEYAGSSGIFMDANENPFGSVGGGQYNRYPDPHQAQLKAAIAKLKGVLPSQLFLGNGSDEPIDLLIKLFCTPHQDQILIMPPTYGMYEVCANIQQVGITRVPLTPEFEIDLAEVKKNITQTTKMVWICSPNNPSGNILSSNLIENLLVSFPETMVVIDEAYIDFTTGGSWVERLSEFENLIVLQTFSKAWGLAGLRIGMCFGNELLISTLSKIKYPYNLNILTQKLALKALKNHSKRNDYVAKIIENRNWLKNKLLKIKEVKKIFPSDSNQLFVQFEEAKNLFEYLIENQIIVRDRTSVVHGENCLRISVGKRKELEKLVKFIRKFYKKGGK